MKKIILGILFIIIGLLSLYQALGSLPWSIKYGELSKYVFIPITGIVLPFIIFGILLIKYRKDDLLFAENKTLKKIFATILLIVATYVSGVIAAVKCAGSKRCTYITGYPFPILEHGNDSVINILIPIVGLLINYTFFFIIASFILRLRKRNTKTQSS